MLTEKGVSEVIAQLRKDFDYIVCDSPAGIESGAHHAMYFADRAVVCTNPELSSCRDSDKMLGVLASKSLRAQTPGATPVAPELVITRYQPARVEAESMLSVDDISEMLGIPLLGVVPESVDVLNGTNIGEPVIAAAPQSDAAQAYADLVARFLGEELDMRFLTAEKKGFFSKMFG